MRIQITDIYAITNKKETVIKSIKWKQNHFSLPRAVVVMRNITVLLTLASEAL